MLGPAGKVAGIYDRVHAWASKPAGDGVTPAVGPGAAGPTGVGAAAEVEAPVQHVVETQHGVEVPRRADRGDFR